MGDNITAAQLLVTIQPSIAQYIIPMVVTGAVFMIGMLYYLFER